MCTFVLQIHQCCWSVPAIGLGLPQGHMSRESRGSESDSSMRQLQPSRIMQCFAFKIAIDLLSKPCALLWEPVERTHGGNIFVDMYKHALSYKISTLWFRKSISYSNFSIIIKIMYASKKSISVLLDISNANNGKCQTTLHKLRP